MNWRRMTQKSGRHRERQSGQILNSTMIQLDRKSLCKAKKQSFNLVNLIIINLFLQDECYSSKTTTDQIYSNQINEIVLSSLQGINGTIFMYGQTGSGKTYTMIGNNSYYTDGILGLSLKNIFTQISKVNSIYIFISSIRKRIGKIYNDQIYDLLSDPENLHEILQINEDNHVFFILYSFIFNKKEFHIRSATDQIINSVEQIFQLVEKGEHNRHYAETFMNHSSSRSHTIFRLMIRCVHPGYKITESILNFVDLAGSEKVQACNNERNKESKHINKSYFPTILRKKVPFNVHYCIILSDLHIPYRNSPLTKLLKSSLGGNSRTAIILCVNPCLSQFEQSISTLRFGFSAKKIQNNVKNNVVMTDPAIYKIILEYEQKIRELEANQAISSAKKDYLYSSQVGIIHSYRQDIQPKDFDPSYYFIKKVNNLQEQVNLFEDQINKKKEIQQTIQQSNQKYKQKYLKYKSEYEELIKNHHIMLSEYQKLYKLTLLYHSQLELNQFDLLEPNIIELILQNSKTLEHNLIRLQTYKQLDKDEQNQLQNTFSIQTGIPIEYNESFFEQLCFEKVNQSSVMEETIEFSDKENEFNNKLTKLKCEYKNLKRDEPSSHLSRDEEGNQDILQVIYNR